MFYVNAYLWSTHSINVASFPITSLNVQHFALSLPTTLLNGMPTAQQAGFSLNVTSGKLSRLLRLGYIPVIDVPVTFDICSYHETHHGDFQ